MIVNLRESYLIGKKFVVEINRHKIHFGADGFSDFTLHHDEDRKHRYIELHRPAEERFWNDPLRASFWTKNILWNKPTIRESVLDIEERYPDIIIFSPY
jgi:hypothetical protein